MALETNSIPVRVSVSDTNYISIEIKYADNTTKKVTFSVGDIISVKYVKDNTFLTCKGDVKNISMDKDAYILIDLVADKETYSAKIYINSIKDINNLTCKEFNNVTGV